MLQAIPYILFILFYYILAILELSNIKPKKNCIVCASLFMMVFFLGFRGFIGADWINYYPNFRDVPTIYEYNWLQYAFSSYYEPFFQVFTSIIKSVYNNYFFYLFINVLIDAIILHYFFSRYSPTYAFSFLIFFVMGGLAIEVDLLRNVKSIMLFLLSVKYIEQKKFLKYLLLNLCGAMFHLTSLLYIPFYFIAKRYLSRRVFIILFSIGVFILVFKINFFSHIVGGIGTILGERFSIMIEAYFFDGDYPPQGLTIGLFDRILTTVLVVVYYNKIIDTRKVNIIFINAYIIYMLVFFYTSESNVVAARLGNLFYFSYWILVPLIYKSMKCKMNRAFFLAYLLIISCYKIGTQRSGSIVDEYENVIFGYETYEERYPKFGVPVK